MSNNCPPHEWSATPVKKGDKGIFECRKCGTYITVDCQYLTKQEFEKLSKVTA